MWNHYNNHDSHNLDEHYDPHDLDFHEHDFDFDEHDFDFDFDFDDAYVHTGWRLLQQWQ